MIFLKTEPIGESYRALLELLQQHCSHFSLILKRSKYGRSQTAKDFEVRLDPYILGEEEVRKWPGTLLGDGGVARFGLYRVQPGSLEVLRGLKGLYQWRLPEHPEDLAFYTPDGGCFFSSTAHETEAMIGSGMISESEFRKSVPGVQFKWYPGSRT